MSALFVPIVIILIIGYSGLKKNNGYLSFVAGAKTSFDLILLTFPYIVAILVVVEVYNASGLNVIIADFLSPAFSLVGIPKQLTELIILKNFTGGGSLAILENIYINYGVDSFTSLCGSAVMGSSEAVFYVVAVFFSKTKVKKFGYAIPVAIIANIVGSVVACAICRIMFL